MCIHGVQYRGAYSRGVFTGCNIGGAYSRGVFTGCNIGVRIRWCRVTIPVMSGCVFTMCIHEVYSRCIHGAYSRCIHEVYSRGVFTRCIHGVHNITVRTTESHPQIYLLNSSYRPRATPGSRRPYRLISIRVPLSSPSQEYHFQYLLHTAIMTSLELPRYTV